MEHLYFVLFNFMVLAIVLWHDRQRLRDYALLSILALIAAFIFENFTTYIGLWIYHSEPKIGLMSLYTWILYVPYISFCYFVGNKLGERK